MTGANHALNSPAQATLSRPGSCTVLAAGWVVGSLVYFFSR